MPAFKSLLSVFLLSAATVVLIGLQEKEVGWPLLALSILSLSFNDKQFGRDLLLVNLSVAILGLTPITTDISYSHMAVMGSSLTAAICLPYLVSRYVFKDYRVKFPFRLRRKWLKSEVIYILAAAVVGYFLIPFYLKDTGAYINWPSDNDASGIIRLFIGTNALGIWDELFFICTVLGLLRHHFKFVYANLIQAVLFTSFLYELGFTGWGPLMIFTFALLQGYIFKKTESLVYVISIHLTVDFILFLALINAHHPNLVDIFIT